MFISRSTISVAISAVMYQIVELKFLNKYIKQLNKYVH